MDIIIKLSPRRIERAAFILIITALIISTIHFCSKQYYIKDTEEPIEEEQPQQETQEQQEQETEPEQEQQQEQTGQTIGDCTAGWACKTPYYKGYQNSDCSWKKETLEACIDGCTDGECNVAEESEE